MPRVSKPSPSTGSRPSAQEGAESVRAEPPETDDPVLRRAQALELLGYILEFGSKDDDLYRLAAQKREDISRVLEGQRETQERIREHLESARRIQEHLETPGRIREHLQTAERITEHLETAGRIQDHLLGRSKKPTVKLSLEVTPELNETLQELVRETNASGKSDVLRKAIALMKVAVEAKRQGKRIGIAEQDQPLATEIVGIGF